MIKEINQSINKINKSIGVEFQLPTPTKKNLQTTQYLNAITTVTCLALGVALSSKVCLSLGIISAASFTITTIEKKIL